jgi:hypothetical protein
MWFFIILNCFFIFKVIYIFKEHLKKVGGKKAYLLRAYSFMKWYPIVHIICTMPATINRVYGIVKSESFPLMIIQSIFDSFEGCLILVVFLMSPGIKYSISICCRRIISRIKGGNSNTVLKAGNDEEQGINRVKRLESSEAAISTDF